MSKLQCPICGNKINIFRKYWQSTWGKDGIIICPICENKLKLKKYGSSISDATLILIFTHWILGVKGRPVLLYILEWCVLTFIQKIFWPILPYDAEKITNIPKRIICTILVVVLMVYCSMEIFC